MSVCAFGQLLPVPIKWKQGALRLASPCARMYIASGCNDEGAMIDICFKNVHSIKVKLWSLGVGTRW